MNNIEDLNLAEPFPGRHIIEDHDGNFYEVFKEIHITAMNETITLPADLTLAREIIYDKIRYAQEKLNNMIIEKNNINADHFESESWALFRQIAFLKKISVKIYFGDIGDIYQRVDLLNPESDKK